MGLNASDVAKGAKDAETSFKKLEDALEKTGSGGAKDLDKIEDSLRDVQNQSKKTGRAVADIEDDARRADRALSDVGDTGGRSLDRVKGGAQELQQEFGQNLGETVSSFSGDLSDLGQVGQDTLGGLAASVASMGPAGLVGAFALAAGALGLGAVRAGMGDAEEKQQALNEAAGKWADAYEDAAGRIVSAAYTVGEINSIANDPERYKEAEKNAKDWGVTTSDAMRAMAGDALALEVAQGALNERGERWSALMKENTDQSGFYKGTQATTDRLHEMGESIQSGTDALKFLNDAMAQGAEQDRARERAIYDYTTAVGTATGETDDLGNAIYKLPDGKEIVVDAKTKKAYEDLDAIEHKKLTEKTATVRMRVDDSELQRYQVPLKVGYVQMQVQNSAQVNRLLKWE